MGAEVAKALDPNQNGVAQAFDPNQNGVAKAFDPNQNGVGTAFHQLGDMIITGYDAAGNAIRQTWEVVQNGLITTATSALAAYNAAVITMNELEAKAKKALEDAANTVKDGLITAGNAIVAEALHAKDVLEAAGRELGAKLEQFGKDLLNDIMAAGEALLNAAKAEAERIKAVGLQTACQIKQAGLQVGDEIVNTATTQGNNLLLECTTFFTNEICGLETGLVGIVNLGINDINGSINNIETAGKGLLAEMKSTGIGLLTTALYKGTETVNNSCETLIQKNTNVIDRISDYIVSWQATEINNNATNIHICLVSGSDLPPTYIPKTSEQINKIANIVFNRMHNNLKINQTKNLDTSEYDTNAETVAYNNALSEAVTIMQGGILPDIPITQLSEPGTIENGIVDTSNLINTEAYNTQLANRIQQLKQTSNNLINNISVSGMCSKNNSHQSLVDVCNVKSNCFNNIISQDWSTDSNIVKGLDSTIMEHNVNIESSKLDLIYKQQTINNLIFTSQEAIHKNTNIINLIITSELNNLIPLTEINISLQDIALSNTSELQNNLMSKYNEISTSITSIYKNNIDKALTTEIDIATTNTSKYIQEVNDSNNLMYVEKLFNECLEAVSRVLLNNTNMQLINESVEFAKNLNNDNILTNNMKIYIIGCHAKLICNVIDVECNAVINQTVNILQQVLNNNLNANTSNINILIENSFSSLTNTNDSIAGKVKTNIDTTDQAVSSKLAVPGTPKQLINSDSTYTTCVNQVQGQDIDSCKTTCSNFSTEMIQAQQNNQLEILQAKKAAEAQEAQQAQQQATINANANAQNNLNNAFNSGNQANTTKYNIDQTNTQITNTQNQLNNANNAYNNAVNNVNTVRANPAPYTTNDQTKAAQQDAYNAQINADNLQKTANATNQTLKNNTGFTVEDLERAKAALAVNSLI